MHASDRPEFVRVVNGLAAIKPGGKVTPEALDIWWLAMADWGLADFKRAASHLAKSCEFMPSPFHFEQLRKAGRLTPGEAWACALDFVRTGGHHHDRGTGLNLVDAAAHMIGGWHAIGMCETAKLGFLERRFCEHFESLQDVCDVREAVPQIASLHGSRLGGPGAVRKFLPPGEESP